MKLLLSFMLVTSISAFADTELLLKDFCSGKKVSLLNPNGMKIELKIGEGEFDPKTPMVVKAEFLPHTLVTEHVNKSPAFTYTYNYSAIGSRSDRRARRSRENRRREKRLVLPPASDLTVRIQTPKRRYLAKAEQRLNTSNLWVVRVSWYQRGTTFSGIDQKTFLRLKQTKDFYELKSPGFCHWETPAAVSSKVYSNPNRGLMNIIRNYEGINQQSHYRGMSLGYNNTVGETPLSFENNIGWLYKDWLETVDETATEYMQRKWVLSRHESGVFGTRHSFTRKNVIKWEWRQSRDHRCMEYQQISQGILDVGVLTEDFYILPPELYSTPEMNEFIENYRPTLNTCAVSPYNNSVVADDTVINADQSIYYYYIQRNLQ